jgi:hypothetical protein
MRFWQCVEGCHETFSSKSLFEEHQRRKHQKTFTPNQLTALIKIHERQFDVNKTVECPLCREKTPFYPQFRQHLGKHQKQLALFALPSDLYQTKEGDDCTETATLEDEAGREGEDTEENDRSDSDVNPQEDGQEDWMERFDPVSREGVENLVTRRSKEGANDELEDKHRVPKQDEGQIHCCKLWWGGSRKDSCGKE